MKVNSKNCPVGEFKFAAVVGQGILNEKASTRKKDVYEYTTTLELDIDDAQDLLDEIDDFLEDNAVKGCKLEGIPYQTNEEYEGVPKGKVWLRAKAKTEYEDPKTGDDKDAKINIYDTNGDKCTLPEGEGIGSGSEGLIIGNIAVWDRGDEYGATLWLSGVQITEYTPYTFEDAPEAKKGSFKGFDKKSAMEKEEEGDEEQEEAPKRRSRRSRR